MTIAEAIALAVFVAVNFAAACSGAYFRPGAWYERLAKPAWTPPNWAFPLVWTVLYVLIAVSGWRVWLAGEGTALTLAMAIYGVQLVLNAGWSALFFGMRRPDLALLECGAFWVAIMATIWAFAAIDTWAALLLVPYLGWVTVAVTLNWAIVRLNPQTAVGG